MTTEEEGRLEALIAEYRAMTIGPLWAALIVESVRGACRNPRFNPKYYTPTGSETWGDGEIEELAQDVIAIKLLSSRMQLRYIVDVAADIRHVHRLLRQNVEQVLFDRLAPSAVRNLVERFIATQEVRPGASLQEPLSDDQAAAAAKVVASMRRVPHRGELRTPKVFTDEQVRAAVPALLEITERPALSRSDLFSILKRALPTFLAAPEFESIDKRGRETGDGDDQARREARWAEESDLTLGHPDLATAVSESAERILDALDAEHREILVNMLRARDDPELMTQQQLAERLGYANRQSIARREEENRSVLRSELADMPSDLYRAVIDRVDIGLGRGNGPA